MPKGGGSLRLSSRDRQVAATFPGAARAKVGNVTARFRGRLTTHAVGRFPILVFLCVLCALCG